MPKYAVDIRGSKFEIDAPDDAHAQAAVEELSKQPQHFDFGQAPGDETNPNLPAGFDPATGKVSHNGVVDKGIAFTGSVLEGVPVAGPALRSGAESLAAGVTGRDKSQINAATNEMMADNPGTALAGNVTGAVAGTLPAMAAAPEVFGIGEGIPLATTMIRSAITGGGIGGADSAVRSGGDPYETLKGAGLGGGLGLLGPVAGKFIGKGVGAVRDFFRTGAGAKAAGMPKAAFRTLAKDMNADALTAAMAERKMAELGPDAMLMDVGPNMQGRAGSIAATPGRGQQVVRSAVDARKMGANQRMAAALDENFGKSTVPSDVKAEIRGNQKALGPEYEDAIANSKAVDTRAIANDLESGIVNERGRAQAELKNVRKMLDITGENVLDPNPRTLLSTRQAIDGMLKDEADSNVRRVLGAARQKIDDELAAKVPGIKAVDAKHAELARQADAYDRGQEVLDSGRGNAIRPQELDAEIATASQPKGLQIGPSAAPMRLRQGARAEIDRIVGTNANDIVKLNQLIKSEGDWNRAKLASLFGQEKADKVFKVLEGEKVFAATDQSVTKNSESARRLNTGEDTAAMSAVDAYKAGGLRSIPRTIMIKALSGAGDAMKAGSKQASNDAMAAALSSKNIDALKAGLARMGPPKSDLAIRRAVQAALMAPAIGGHNR